MLDERYEFYYDVVLRGQYTFYLPTLHAKYGPIIRINPYELHISDPTYYDTLYASSASGEKRDKWEWYTKQFDIPGSMFSTVGHDQHKARRAAFNRFFSMAGARKLQPVVQERVEQLLSRLRALKNENEKPIKINHAFAAFTNGKSRSYLLKYGRFASSYIMLLPSILILSRYISLWTIAIPSGLGESPKLGSIYHSSLVQYHDCFMNVLC